MLTADVESTARPSVTMSNLKVSTQSSLQQARHVGRKILSFLQLRSVWLSSKMQQPQAFHKARLSLASQCTRVVLLEFVWVAFSLWVFMSGVQVWPGATHFPDFLSKAGVKYWTKQLKAFHELAPYDGLWIDMNEASNFCTGDVCHLPAQGDAAMFVSQLQTSSCYVQLVCN